MAERYQAEAKDILRPLFVDLDGKTAQKTLNAILTLVKTVEADTVERCARVVEQFVTTEIGQYDVCRQHLAAAIRNQG